MSQCRMCGVNTFSEVCTWCFENDSNWKEIKNLRQQVADLKNKCVAADGVAEDFILEANHAPFCRWDNSNDTSCSCMNRKYFNPQSNLERARQFQKDYPKTEEV